MALAFNLFEIFEYRDHFCFFCLHVLSTFGEKTYIWAHCPKVSFMQVTFY